MIGVTPSATYITVSASMIAKPGRIEAQAAEQPAPPAASRVAQKDAELSAVARGSGWRAKASTKRSFGTH
jgi:hypothetical protein